MLVVQIGGSGRGAGKTAIGCELIRAMPELRWLAVKISPHEHDVPDGAIEETDADSQKDTGRYLAAGAKRVFLIGAGGGAPEIVRSVRMGAKDCDAVLIETGALFAAELAGPDEARLTLVVLGGEASEWKPGTLERAGSADAIVLVDGMDRRLLPEGLRHKLSFGVSRGEWKSAALAAFVQEKLRKSA